MTRWRLFDDIGRLLAMYAAHDLETITPKFVQLTFRSRAG